MPIPSAAVNGHGSSFSDAANQLLRSVASHPTEQGARGQAVAAAKSTSGWTKDDAKAAKNKKEREKTKARKAGTAPGFLPKQQWLAMTPQQKQQYPALTDQAAARPIVKAIRQKKLKTY
jgi:hypothetical protein